MAAKAPNAFEWARQPQNCPFPLGDLDSHLIHGFLVPFESMNQSVSQSRKHF